MGRTLRDVWREKGFSATEIEEKFQARVDLIKAVRARTMALRKEKEALSFGLGDAVMVATIIESSKKELSREFKVSGHKGVRHQATVVKKQQQRLRSEQRSRAAAYNPKVKGLAGVPGIETSEDGTIGLEELRKQRPDIFEMKPTQVEGSAPGLRRFINEKMKARGQEDKFYDRTKGD